MKKYIFKIIPILLFIIIFSIFFSGEYINFHKEKKEIIKENLALVKQIDNFSIENIKSLENIDLLYGPEENVLEKILEKIKNAKNKIYIEVYMLTETRIQEAIKKNKNLDIKIILEKNPYKAISINNKAYDFFIKNNINVVWSNPNNYSLNHSKLIIIDDEAIISTGNFTYSSFKNNREFYILIKDQKIVQNLNGIFNNDYLFNTNIVYNNNLVISPNYSRKKLEYIINNVKNNIDMYFPYIQDKNLENLLIQKSKDGININLIVDKNIEINDTYNNLINSGIKIIKLNKKKLHAKAILIDNKILYIGSINFSSYSLDKNREIGILIKNADIIKKFIEIFKKDNM